MRERLTHHRSPNLEPDSKQQGQSPKRGQTMQTTMNASRRNEEHPVPCRQTQTIELAVFLLLIVPSMALSFFAVKQGTLSFTLVAIATISRDVALVALLFYFLWRNAEPRERIGWHGRHFWREIGLGVVLFPLLFFASSWVENWLLSIGLSVPSTPTPSLEPVGGIWQYVLAVLLVGVVAISEETVFRGYLILRLHSITDSWTAAVLLSAIVFSIGHGYEGTAGVGTVGFMGVMLALVYLWRRSLVAPVVIHFLVDFLAIVAVPLIGGK
jgi:membrane protease YdiL (CAAX protease family)